MTTISAGWTTSRCGNTCDQYREIEGRVEWDDAADFAREPYELKAMRCLEAGLPQDVEFLRQMIKECEHLIDVL
jgi:hypothetical protein